MTTLRDRIRRHRDHSHVEATMTFPNALMLKPTAWRANREETPCGGLTPMGVHAVDGMIDLCGPIDHVFCQSFRRVVEIDSDDTTSILFRMKAGMSGYLSTMTATGPGFSFQVFGSKGWVRLEGMTHVAGASSDERRTRLFGTCRFRGGETQVWGASRPTSRGRRRVRAGGGGTAYPSHRSDDSRRGCSRRRSRGAPPPPESRTRITEQINMDLGNGRGTSPIRPSCIPPTTGISCGQVSRRSSRR
jgi:predicted dehydrogenase